MPDGGVEPGRGAWIPAGHRDARGSGWAEREEVSFTLRDAHTHAASAGSSRGLQHVLGGGRRLDFQKLLLPLALQPLASSPPLPAHSCPLQPLPQLCPGFEGAPNPTMSPRGLLLLPSHAGPAGPGISGKTNSGGEQVTRCLGVFVRWQAHWKGGGGVRGPFSLFGRHTNDENPAMGAREPGARLLGGR